VIARVIDAEEMQRRALLREPCAAVLGKKKPSLIDSDMEQAAMGIRGAAAAIQGTIFADSEPFDPRKAVTDLVGS
jgi:L-lactate utilization protein LutC